jgi:DNA polymerase-1
MLTNVVACRPPDNATPPTAAVTACRPRLISELRSSGCDIVTVGGTATQALVDDNRNITAARVGPPKQPIPVLRRDDREVRAIPTWHPAYCLRNPDAFPAMVTDIGKAFRKNWVKWEEPSWKYYDEPELALAALDALMSWQEQHNRYELVIDIECGIEKDVVFDHPNQYQMLCVGLAYAKGKAIVIGEKAFADDAVKVLLGRLLERSKLIGHNLKFDLQGLWKYYKNLTTFFDTMIAHYVIDERPGQHSLDMLGQEILGAPNWKYVIQRYIPKGGNYADVPREILYKYCAFDCAVTWDLYEVLRQDLDDLGTPDPWPYPDVAPRTARELHDWLVAKADQLMFLELNGVTVDLEYSRELGGTYQEYLNKLEEDLDAVVNEATNGEVRYINPRSPKQVKEFLEREGCRVEKTDRDTLEALLKRADPESTLGRFLRQMLFHRKEQKKMSTYVTGIRRRVRMGRVFTTYLLHGTTSGRLASRNPNLQNIMRDKQIRNQFVVSKEDNVFVHCDYRQAEGRVIAWLARDEYLRSVFADPDQDLFNTLGARLYGVDPEDLDKEKRVRTKAYFYGLGYGREAYSIAMEYELPVRTVERDLEAFFDMLGNVRPWQESIKQTVHERQELITPFGRRRTFALITEENRKDVEKEALSYLPQSTASDICLDALGELRPALRGKAFLRMTIHDALIAECHKSKAEEVGALMQEVMIRKAADLQTYVPFDVDVSIGKRWGEL